MEPGGSTYTLGESACLFHADCRDALRALPDNCVDAVCTDPPYALVSVVKRFGGANAAPAQFGKDGAFARQSAGFMGKTWDNGEVAFDPGFWAEVLRVLKPGGHVVAMGGTRTYHHLAMAIETAGFEIRDSLMWVYGTGFNKKGYIRNADGEIVEKGWAGALKPAFEPIVCARKPLSEKTVALNMARWGTGALNIDACRVPLVGIQEHWKDYNPSGKIGFGGGEGERTGPAYNEAGRWPANLIHSGENCVIEAFPVLGKASGVGRIPRERGKRPGGFGNVGHDSGDDMPNAAVYSDEGSAARFFACCPYDESEQAFCYSAKASKADRAGSLHPTIKPLKLANWLVKLTTPKGGIVLDPFAGSGTTGQAALANGFKCLLVEREAEYVADICRRLGSPPLVPHVV